MKLTISGTIRTIRDYKRLSIGCLLCPFFVLRRDYETDHESMNSSSMFCPMWLLHFAESVVNSAKIPAIITVRKFHHHQVQGSQINRIPRRPLHRLLNNQFG